MKLWLMGFVFIVAMVGVGITVAFQTGERSKVFASGNVVLESEFEKNAKGMGTLYLVIFDENSPMPMPFGAVRFRLDQDATKGAFFRYAITKEKIQLMPGSQEGYQPSKMRIKARLDKDGFAGPDKSGDIVGEVSGIPFGSTGFDSHLKKAIP